jgi:hypothetical protein
VNSTVRVVADAEAEFEAAPYLVLYRLRGDYVEVMAFAHTRRRPGY